MRILIPTALLLLTAANAQAATTYLSLWGNPEGPVNAPVQLQSDFTLTPEAGQIDFVSTPVQFSTCPWICEVGATALGSADSSFSLSQDAGLAFDLTSFSFQLFPQGDPELQGSAFLTLQGEKLNGQTVSTVMEIFPATYGNDFNFSTYTDDPAFSNFTRLTTLTFSMETYSEAPVNISSVAVNVVPVPAAVWLFGSALLSLGWLRRPK
jgi:hypothetical protein